MARNVHFGPKILILGLSISAVIIPNNLVSTQSCGCLEEQNIFKIILVFTFCFIKHNSKVLALNIMLLLITEECLFILDFAPKFRK